MNPVLFAIAAAISFGVWTIFHRLAAPHINQVFGAVSVSLTAVIFGGLILLTQKKTGALVSNSKGILFVVLAGLSAFFIDFFALKTYNSGLPVTIAGPIIIGGSIAVATVIGFFLGDSISATKLVGLVLLISGAAILAIYQK